LAPIAFGYGVTVTFHTRAVTGQDAHGGDIYTDTDTTVPNCGFDPGGSQELVQGQDIVTSQPTVYAPAGTVIGPVDAVTVNGTRYDVDGSPNAYVHPFSGWQTPVVVKLKGVSG
jgi:hypothetical protein